MEGPAATTVKDAAAGAHTVTFTGCVVILDAVVTVSVAAWLFTELGQVLLATTRYWLPLIAGVTAVRVKVALVAPVIFVQVPPPLVLTCHWYAGDDPALTTVKLAFAPEQAV